MKNRKMRIISWSLLSLLVILTLGVISLETFWKFETSRTIHVDAPVIIKKSIVVNAPVEKVWRIFTDVDNWDAWQKEIVDPKLNGEFRVGTTFNWKTGGLTITSTLQTVEVNKMVGWSGPALGAFAIHTWYFTEQDGKTTIRVEESMEGWLVEMLKSKFQSGLDKSTDNWLNYLKIKSEDK